MIQRLIILILLSSFLVSYDKVSAQNTPIAENDTFSITSGVLSSIDVLANDVDPDGGSLGVLSTTLPSNGIVTNGLFVTYQSNFGYSGLDSFLYVIIDIEGLTDTATVYLDVIALNQPPVSKSDSFTVTNDIPYNLVLNTNDYDPDNHDYQIAWLSGSMNSSSTIVNDSTINYIANSGYVGLDSFFYLICDFGIPSLCSDTTVVYVDVLAGNNAPIGMNDSVLLNQGDSIFINVLINDSDPDGDSISISNILMAPQNGVASIENNSIKYISHPCYYGLDSLSYLLCDDQNPMLCDTAVLFIGLTQSIQVSASSDSTSLVALDSIVLDVQMNDTLFNGISASTDIVSVPAQGTISVINNDSILYVPFSSFSGTDSFTYQLCDDCEYCDTAEVIISYFVFNLPPQANDDYISLSEDQDSLLSVLANDYNPFSGISLTLGLLDPPVNGIISSPSAGQLFYQPNNNYFGLDSFTYVICAPSSGECDTASVFITISSVDDVVIALDDNVNGIEDQILTVPVLNNDVDIDSNPLVVFIYQAPTNGVASVNSFQEIVYNPSLNFNGADQLTYVVCDTVNPVLCDTAIVSFNIIGVNDVPYANDENSTTSEDNLLIINPLLNDVDPDGDDISASFIYLPSNGSAIFLNGDSILYNPNLNYNGIDSLAYLVCDDIYPPLCDTAVVYITITSINDKPVALDDNGITEQGYPITIDVQANDTDIESQPLNTTIITTPFNGTISLPSNNEIIYQPNSGYTGLDQFVYSICDNGAPILCDTATVFITVTANASPVAVNDTAYTSEGMPINIDVLSNDYDPNDINLSYTILGIPSDGVALNNFNGSFTYTPNPNFQGWDSFTYFINDDGVPQGEDVGTVFILVSIPNETPVAVNDSIEILEGDSVIINLLINDIDPDGDILYISDLGSGTLGNIYSNSSSTVIYEGIYGNNGTDIISYEACDSLGACSSASIIITIKPFSHTEIADFIPNTITPNTDGYNDFFKIPNIELYQSSLRVYDRWGVQVFSAENYRNDWEGTYENTSLRLPAGTYYYTINLKYLSENAIFQNGYIQLIY